MSKADFTPVDGTNDRVVSLIAHRLEYGQNKYKQDMQLEDERDMIQESLEEVLDSCVYIATELIKLKDRVGKYSDSKTMLGIKQAEGLFGKDY